MSKKVKQNRYKPEPGVPASVRARGLGRRIYRITALPFLICVFSLAAIYAHDAVVQSPFFTIETIELSGEKRVPRQEILKLAGLNEPRNIFQVNLFTLEKQIASHPWIAAASVRRSLFSTLRVSVIEEEPLAIVSIENLTDILINTQGKPFKEYDPSQDRVESLPVISGVDLSRTGDRFQFEGPMFNAIMDLLKAHIREDILSVTGNDSIGVIIRTPDTFNREPAEPESLMPITLGFDNFAEKMKKARKISQYIHANVPDKTICAMDLFDIDKVFIKTADTDALHSNLEKGV